MRSAQLLLLLAASPAIVIPAPRLHAQLPDAQITPPIADIQPSLHLTFPIGLNVGRGDDIFVPVTLGGKERLFVLDTGSAQSTLDTSLISMLGPELSTGVSHTPSGQDLVHKQFRMNSLTVGGKILRNARGDVAATDLTDLRKDKGRPIDGILGIDFLANYIVRLDFARHLLEIGDLTLDQDPGIAFPIESDNSLPVIAINFIGVPNVLVLLDTGDSGTGTLAQPVLARLGPAEWSGFNVSSSDLAGQHTALLAAIHRPWSLAGNAFNDLSLAIASRSSLGLEALADYVLTLDFPHNRLYLKKVRTAHENVPSGSFPLILDGDKFLVDRPSDYRKSQGVQNGDQLLQLDGKDVAGEELWKIKYQLGLFKTSFIKIRRGDQTLNLTIHGEILPPLITAPASSTYSAPPASRP